MHMAVQGLA